MTENQHIKDTIIDVLLKELNTLRHGQNQYKDIEPKQTSMGNKNATEMIAFYQKRIEYYVRAINLINKEL